MNSRIHLLADELDRLKIKNIRARCCDRRFALMWHNGAVAEVEALLARKLDPALPVMRAIGVAEVTAFLSGTLIETEALAAGSQATRRYAKRQYTWLRHQPPAEWPRITLQNSPPDSLVEALLHK